ncbi:MAG: 16S rRNA (guanine(966)-N(2))-methyltransferase RsmD [Acidobacteria bacterium]|nr:16S rRNA (guanine(966)-N(2))-methyltransferase RsmD [Acidobacteriota bacterium]
MRIVAGTLKGRRLDGPTWDGLRPTSDSLRETLFNVLGPTLDGARVLDVFAGTGAVGIEAISRGAAHVTFIEQDPRAIALLTRNVAHVGIDDTCIIVRDDFMKPRAKRTDPDARYDLIFLDPPYEIPLIEAALTAAAAKAATGGRIVIEHSRRRALPDAVPGATRYRVLEAGDSALSFYTSTEGV